MTEKRIEFARLIRQGVSGSEACRRLGIDRKTGHWWKNGGSVTRNGVATFVKPVIDQRPEREESGRYLSESERVKIADGAHAGRSARKIAAELGRAVSTVSRELQRNQSADGGYRPHAAQAMMRARRPRPKARRLESDGELRGLAQGYLDQRWSPEQVAHELDVTTATTSLSRRSTRRSTAPSGSCNVMPAACYAPAGPTGALAVVATNDDLGSSCRSR